MNRLSLIVSVLVALIAPGLASPADNTAPYSVADEFRAGVLGFAWGTDLEQIARNFRAGIAWPGISPESDPPVERFYAVADDTPVLGISRKGQQTMFGFDRSNRLTYAIFSVPHAAKSDLLSHVRNQFGPPKSSRVEGLQARSTWGTVDGIAMMIVEIPHATRPALFVIVRASKP